MIRNLTTGLALAALMGGAAFAETHEVEMLNKGSDGERMVFEPSVVHAQPGDVIKFVPTDRGHNAESIEGMIPEGAEEFAGRIGQEVEYTVEEEGLYAVECKPHYAMGMVMTIAVGEEIEVPEDYLEGRIPRKALERFEAQLEELAALDAED